MVIGRCTASAIGGGVAVVAACTAEFLSDSVHVSEMVPEGSRVDSGSAIVTLRDANRRDSNLAKELQKEAAQ